MQNLYWDLLVFRFLVTVFGGIGRRGDTEVRQSGFTFSLTGGSSTVGPRPRGVLTPASIPSSPNQCCTVVPTPLHTDRGLPWCLLCWAQIQGTCFVWSILHAPVKTAMTIGGKRDLRRRLIGPFTHLTAVSYKK